METTNAIDGIKAVACKFVQFSRPHVAGNGPIYRPKRNATTAIPASTADEWTSSDRKFLLQDHVGFRTVRRRDRLWRFN